MSEAHTITEAEVYRAVCQVTGLNRYWLRTSLMRDHFCQARVVAALALRDWCDMSWPQIAASLNRAHSSVIEIHRRRASDQEVVEDLQRVHERLRQLRKAIDD